MLACYFLLNFGLRIYVDGQEAASISTCYFSFEFWRPWRRTSRMAIETTRLAIFFWILVKAWGSSSKSTPRPSTCYFLLNFGRWRWHTTLARQASIRLAIFFWILEEGGGEAGMRGERSSLAIFFWILSEVSREELKKLVLDLLFSFEFCCGVCGEVWAEADTLYLAIFFWILYWPRLRTRTLCDVSDLLFSFEFCWYQNQW